MAQIIHIECESLCQIFWKFLINQKRIFNFTLCAIPYFVCVHPISLATRAIIGSVVCCPLLFYTCAACTSLVDGVPKDHSYRSVEIC